MLALLLIGLINLTANFTATADGQYRKNFVKQVYVNGVGQIKLVYKFAGEPVSRPRSLQIWVKCAKAKTWEPVGEYQMCELNQYELKAKEKKLVVSYNDGRADPTTGRSYCDVRGEGTVDLSPLCN